MHEASSLLWAFCLTVKPEALHVPPCQEVRPITSHAWSVATVTAFAVTADAPVLLLVVPAASIGVVLSTPVKPRQIQPWSQDAPAPVLVNVLLATLPSAQYP